MVSLMASPEASSRGSPCPSRGGRSRLRAHPYSNPPAARQRKCPIANYLCRPTGESILRKQRRNDRGGGRSEEHTSELQSHLNLVCRLLLESKANRAATTDAAHHVRHADLT